MNVLFAGDWHANAHHARRVIEHAAHHGFDRVVQVGDFGYWPRFRDGISFLGAVSRAATEHGVTVHFCDGNHEDHFSLQHRSATAPVELAPRIWWVPRGSVLEWSDRRILFMGGAVSIDRHRRQPGVTWFVDEVPGPDSWERAATAGPVDIVVAHDTLPGMPVRGVPDRSVPEDLLAEAAEHRRRLGEVEAATNPALWVHGHWHQRRSWERQGCRIESLAADGHSIEDSTLACDLDRLTTWVPGIALD